MTPWWQPPVQSYPNPPNHPNHLNLYHFCHDFNPFMAAAPQTGGDMGLSMAQSVVGHDATMPFAADLQHSTSGNEHLTTNNAAPPPHPIRQGEMAGWLHAVNDGFAGCDSPGQGHRPRQRRPRARAPSPKEWELHKAAIHELYITSNITLAYTIESMKKLHGFHATEKMYKDKFKQWKWFKNATKAFAPETPSDNQKRPISDIDGLNDQTWPIEQIKNRTPMSSLKAPGEASSLQEGKPSTQHTDSTTLDGHTGETPPLPLIPDNGSALDNSRGIGGACFNTGEDVCKSLDKGPRRVCFDPDGLYSRVREVMKASGEDIGTCNHEDVESALIDALSCYNHHFSPTHSKTLEIGYLLVSFYFKMKRVSHAHCIVDWMTKKHCGDTKSCNGRIVTHVLSIIDILRQTWRDEEADSLTYRLLEHHQASDERHFLLKDDSMPYVESNQRVEHLLASSEPEKLATMSDILERLSTDSNNHKLLQDLLPPYIQKCDQPTLEKQAIHSLCIFAAILAKNAQFEKAIYSLREGERRLHPLLVGSIDAQCPSELSTLKLAQRLAFTFVDANDPDACSRVLSTALEHLDSDKFNDIRTGYNLSVYEFLTSTASGLHRKDVCEKTRPWMNQALSKSQALFGDYHDCTKRIREMIHTCTMDIVVKDALRAQGAPY